MKYMSISAFMLLASCLMTSIKANVLDREKLEQVYVLVKDCNLRHHTLEVFKNPDADENILEETRCSAGCVMRKLDMITEDYTLNVDGVNNIKLFLKYENNSPINHAGFNCTKCAKVRGTNDCDFAGKYLSCIVDPCSFSKNHSSY